MRITEPAVLARIFSAGNKLHRIQCSGGAAQYGTAEQEEKARKNGEKKTTGEKWTRARVQQVNAGLTTSNYRGCEPVQ